jgi:hypothetical protein
MACTLWLQPILAQTERIEQPHIQPGCPTALFGIWSTSDDPDFHPIEPDWTKYSTQTCYDCLFGICDLAADPECPPCMQIIKLDMVFNPRKNTYETIYQVKTINDNGVPYIYYTYKIYKVPVWQLDDNGNRIKIIGYKYYWLKIPELTGYTVDPNGGGLIMKFE